ncbi:ATP-grasp fold amidoligase family protein [Photobacterium kishitanii]|uniref:ATP-grasp fold amidoligase family protein n=1 Tax=Photobacterium kishitanii TaxID=318456 RepID=UPI000D17D581|nr:ATP-grasp fold amidoligase family protein [Photobacterium kishitanii]PSV07057.1 glycosyltransferase [Photobacterium kishitanii]
MRKIINLICSKSKLARDLRFKFSFIRKTGYIPSFTNPKTFNEKINYRKNNYKHELFSVCSDKIKSKEYVAEKLSEDYIIENYYVGDNITTEKLKELLTEKGDLLLKANHNSGPVYLITTDATDDEIKRKVDDVNNQLTQDYGKRLNEPWYSEIKPRVLVEKRLLPQEGETDIRDYKFHIFKQNDGSFKIVLQVDFERNDNYTRSFFDEDLNWLPFHSDIAACIHTSIEKPKNYDEMLAAAKILAEPFSYVRVDFYNVDGAIYFGELTFAHGSGRAAFCHKVYDLWLGRLWQNDPSY